MAIYCIGLSHRTAPVEVRERFSVGQEAIPPALDRLRTACGAAEAVWLSTCNRVELYAVGDDALGDAIRRFFVEHSRHQGMPPEGAMYLMREPASVEHLFRVASGLDSMVLGETEILGQLKKAYELARQHGATGARLNKAFQRAFNVSKQVRSETLIQRGGISVASVGVELAERVFETVEGRSVLVIGAGETGEKVARALISRGARSVFISNRSPEKAQALALELGDPAVAIGDWSETAAKVDVIVSSTSFPGYILEEDRVRELMVKRHRRPLLLIDLAVPRDVDPAVIGLPDVYLFNVDDLQAIADAHRREREAEVARCEALIREKAAGLVEDVSRPRPTGSNPMSAPA